MKVRHGRVYRREYSEDDFHFIELMGEFRRQEYPPRIAYAKALERIESAALNRPPGFFGPLQDSITTDSNIEARAIMDIADKLLPNFPNSRPIVITPISDLAKLVAGVFLTQIDLSNVSFAPVDHLNPRWKSYIIANLKSGEHDRVTLVMHDGSSEIVDGIEEISLEHGVQFDFTINLSRQ